MRKLLALLTVSLLLAGPLLAQRTVTGTVTDDKGNPVANASVMVKGTSSGTSTKSDGSYSLVLPEKARALVFSAVDMSPLEVIVGNQTVINTSLKPIESVLAEVVVVGYGVQQKKAFTGSASRVDAKEFSNLLTPSVDKQLAGRAAGVQVTNTSGIVNAPSRIRIRGTNSINQTNDPLFVVDGIPIITGNLAATTNSNAIGDINPADIESIEILKDGSATAIYGSRAAAGVVLITTKKGEKGKLKMNYDGFVGFNSVLKRWDLLNADEFITIANEKLANAGQAARAGVNPGGVNTDWQKEALVDNATVQNHNISVQGGSGKSTYYMSLNYSRQQGTIISNWNKAYRVRANLENEVNKFIRIGNNITLSRQEDADQNTGSNSLGGAIASTLRLLPNVSPYSTTHPSGFNIRYNTAVPANAMENGPNSQGVDDNYFNIAFVLKNNKYYSDKYRLIDNAFIELSPVKGLKIRSQFAYDMLNDYSWQSWDPRHGDGYSQLGLVYNADQSFARLVYQNYFNYNLSLKGHNVYLTGGHELQNTKTKFLTATGTGISDLFFMKENIISGSASVPSIGGSYSRAGFESFFGRFNYDYKSKYFVQASIRRDGQSSLAPDKRYGTFPGFSAGWRPSEENFWKTNAFLSKWFTEAKLKGSYAKVGNSLGGLPYLSTFGVANYGNISGIAVNGIGNTDLQWETSKKYDAGIELNMLKGTIQFTADWFLNDVDNLILDVPVPLSAGVPGNSIKQNIGTLRNKGIELSVDIEVLKRKDFQWNLSANYSSIKNKITKLYSISGVPIQQIFPTAYNIIRVGDPINMIWGYEFAGVNTANGNPMYVKADGSLVQLNLTGAANTIGVYYKANGKDDGTLGAASTLSSTADRKVLGLGIPTWFGGVSNSFQYKGFGLEFMFRYSGGNKIMNTTAQEALFNQSFQNNGKDILNRWTTAGQVTDVPKLRWGQGNNINTVGLANSRFVEKGDYLRLQNVVISYSVDGRLLQKLTNGYVQNVKMYVQGQNLYVWTKYSGADPDNVSTGGIDQSVAPQIRTISAGLSVGF